MDEHQLLAVLLEETECRDCPVAHASGGPSRCEFKTRVFGAGDSLYGESEPADCVWFVKSGVVTMGHEKEDSAHAAVRDSLIGVDCLVSPTRLSDAVAATEVHACSMSKSALMRWLAGDREKLRLVIDAAVSDPNVASVIDKLP